MRKVSYLILAFLAFSNAYAVEGEGQGFFEMEALKEWIATKRQVTVQERGGNLSLSGDVRFKYRTINEHKNGFRNVGSNSGNPNIPDNQWDIDFNFLLDYRTDITWSTIKVEFANDMGTVSGSTGGLSLERAFLGFRFLNYDNFTADIEAGRRRLNYTFDSKVEFGSLMDGLLLKYDQSSDLVGDFYTYLGGFIVNERINQFATVLEAGIFNFFDTGLYGKYSIIDWFTKSFLSHTEYETYRFIPNQFILGWTFVPPRIDKVTTFYTAFLVNPVAKKIPQLDGCRGRIGAYLGFSMGEIRKTGDWSFDINMQYMQPQVVPDFDFSGIGNGNAGKVGLYSTNMNGSGAPTTRANAAGKSNYFGWRVQFLYVAADALTVSQTFEMSWSLGFLPTHFSLKKYRFELVYAW